MFSRYFPSEVLSYYTIGTYEVEILAVDSSKNTSRKNVVIDVIEKEKEIVEVPGKGSSSGTSNNNSNNSGSSGGSSSGSSSGGSSNNSSGGSTGGSNNTGNSQPFLETPGSITVGVNSSIDDLFFKLQQGLNSSGTVSITVSEVNLSVPGSYSAKYSTSDGLSASCTVIVE